MARHKQRGSGKAPATTVTVIGSSASTPTPSNPNSGFLVTTLDKEGNPYRLLLDCGSGVAAALGELGVIDKTGAMLISHMHADHAVDVYNIAQDRSIQNINFRFPGEGEKIDIFAPHPPEGPNPPFDDIMTYLDNISNDRGLTEGKTDLKQEFNYHKLTQETPDDSPIGIGPFRAWFIPMGHYIDNYGIRLEAPDGTIIAYTGDTGPMGRTSGPDLDPNDKFVKLASKATIGIFEAKHLVDAEQGREGETHLSARQAGWYAARLGIDKLWLSHVGKRPSPEEALRRALQEARQEFPGAVLAMPGLSSAPEHKPISSVAARRRSPIQVVRTSTRHPYSNSGRRR